MGGGERKQNDMAKRYIAFMGQTLCVTEWARKFGLNPTTLNKRLQTGMDIKTALFRPLGNARTLVIGGEATSTVELAKRIKVSLHTIRGRKYRGWRDDELALSLQRNRPITAFGETLPISEWAKRAGLDTSTIRQRLTAGWSPEEAVLPRQSKGTRKKLIRKREAFGKAQTLSEWAAEYNIKYQTLNARLHSGLSLEVALRLPVDKNLSRSKKE